MKENRITMTDFIEKVDYITGQHMTDEKANELCKLFAAIYRDGYDRGIEKACTWLYDHLYTKVDENSPAHHWVQSKDELTQTEFVDKLKKDLHYDLLNKPHKREFVSIQAWNLK